MIDDRLDRDDAAQPADDGGLRTPDGYHRGTIVRLYYGSGTGTLRSDSSGRELKFKWPFVEIRGPIPRLDALREGMSVGFDVSWTSAGERVSVIKVYE